MATRNNTSPSSNNEATTALNEDLEKWIQFHKSCFEIFLDAYCIVDTQNRVVDFNIAFTELVGESYRRIQKVLDFCTLLKTELCPHDCPAVQVLRAKAA